MTFVPLIVGIVLGHPSWWQGLLTLTWTAAFFSFHAFGLWVKARCRRRYRTPTFTYGALAGAGALTLVVKYPHLLWWALPFTALFGVVVVQLLRRNDRSLSARISEILASSLMLPVANSLGSAPASAKAVVTATILVAAYFIGTVPYVKTLIRERTSNGWLHASITYHVLGVVITAGCAFMGLLNVFIPIVWLVLLIRAYLYPLWSRRREAAGEGPLPPVIIGVSEFGFCALVLISVVWNFH